MKFFLETVFQRLQVCMYRGFQKGTINAERCIQVVEQHFGKITLKQTRRPFTTACTSQKKRGNKPTKQTTKQTKWQTIKWKKKCCIRQGWENFSPKITARDVLTYWTFTDGCYKRERGKEEGTHNDKVHPVPTVSRFAAAIKTERSNMSREMVTLLS